jgi:hypothetical protein
VPWFAGIGAKLSNKRRKDMRQPIAFTSAFTVAAALTTDTPQAETYDFAKITCDEISNAFLQEVVVIGAWLNGYFNAKRNNTVVDMKQIEANTAKVLIYCRANPQVTVMRAIELLNEPK